MAKKLPQFPKAPKAGASLGTLQNYHKKAQVVAKKRADILSDRKKKSGIRESVKKLKDKY